MKAADLAISKGSYSIGLDLLNRAHSISKHPEEHDVVHRVVDRGLKDIVRSAMKKQKDISGPIGARGSFSTQLQTVEAFSRSADGSVNAEANLTMAFRKLKETLDDCIAPITVQVHGEEGGHILQLKPIVRNAPLFSVREASERDLLGAFRMMSFMSSRSVLSNRSLLSNADDNQDTTTNNNTGAAAGEDNSMPFIGGPHSSGKLIRSNSKVKSMKRIKSRRGSFSQQQSVMQEQIAEEEDSSSAPSSLSKQFSMGRLKRMKSRLTRAVCRPFAGLSDIILDASCCCCADAGCVDTEAGCCMSACGVHDEPKSLPRIPIRRKSLFSGPGAATAAQATPVPVIGGTAVGGLTRSGRSLSNGPGAGGINGETLTTADSLLGPDNNNNNASNNGSKSIGSIHEK
jgi:hypothetical protein